MSRSISKVLPGLYIGGILDAREVFSSNRHDITHVISLRSSPKHMIKLFHYTHIPISDSMDENISKYFSLCNDLIHQARLESKDNNVLVHCYAGISRSATIVIAYLMTIANISWDTAWNVLSAVRPWVRPNPIFLQQLRNFQKYGLKAEQRRLYAKFPNKKLQAWDSYRIDALLATFNNSLSERYSDTVFTSSSSVDVGDSGECYYDCPTVDEANNDGRQSRWGFLKWLSFQ